MMPMTARSPIQGAHDLAASGRIGRATRTKPYVPSLRRTAARITEPTVGASVWASGSQVWNGNIGTLMAKPRNRPPKMRSWVPWASPALCCCDRATMSKVWGSLLKNSARKLSSVRAVVRRVACLMSSSLALGIASTTAIPTIGMNVARLSAQESNQFIGSFLLGEENQRQAEQADGGEEHESVLLDPPGLDEPEDPAGLRGTDANAVDDTVDALLVDDVVGEATHGFGTDPDGVDDAVDDVLVGPVGGPGDRALDGADHAADEDMVEVVLLDEERVERPEGRDPPPGALGR